MAEMGRIVFNDRIDAGLSAIFVGVVLAILVYAVRTCLIARAIDRPSVTEVPPEMVAAE
jgi:carbon starvation protein